MSVAGLALKVQDLQAPSREIDAEIALLLCARKIMWQRNGRWRMLPNGSKKWVAVPHYTGSIDAAVALVKQILPGWGWRVATCCVSDDAWLFPDFNCPVHGPRLTREVSMDIDWAECTDVDRRPPGNEPIALVQSLLIALFTLGK